MADQDLIAVPALFFKEMDKEDRCEKCAFYFPGAEEECQEPCELDCTFFGGMRGYWILKTTWGEHVGEINEK